MDAGAEPHDRGHEVRDPVGVDGPDRDPAVLQRDGAERRQRPVLRGGGVREIRHPEPDRRLAQEVAQRARCHHAPVVDDRDPVAQPLHLAQEVGVEQHRGPAFAGLADDRPHVAAPDRVQRGRRLVQDHECGIPQQRRREAQALLHPLAEAAGPLVGAIGEAGEGQHPLDLCRSRARCEAGQGGVETEHLVGREPGLVPEQLGQVADPAARLAVPDPTTEHRPLARRRPRQAEQQLDRRRLARPVGAEEAEHLAGLDVQVERVERHGPAVDLAQRVGLDGGGHRASFSGLTGRSRRAS